MSMSKINPDIPAIVDISRKDFDGFRFVFGNKGLDLANGGSTVLIEGQAGVGKTVLALQMATSYLNTRDKSKEYVLYVAFEQPADSLEVLLNRFDFFGFRDKTQICKCPQEFENHKLKPPGKLHILSRPPLQDLGRFIDFITRALTEFKGCAMLVLDSIGVFESTQNPKEREELDRLCNGARLGGYALVMVREKEPRAAEAVVQYVTDTVFELQFKPMNLTLPYGPLVRTIEIKKSRVQKSDRGPHEFEIRDGLGIVIYPSCASVFQAVYEDEQRIYGGKQRELPREKDSIEVFDCEGGELVDKHLTHDVDIPGSRGLRLGQALLLYARPGSLKTLLGFHFLRQALKSDDEDFLFLTFKIDMRALEGIVKSYLASDTEEYRRWVNHVRFIDARQTFWTPARVLAEVRKEVIACKSNRGLKRAFVFGIGMIDRLPAFQGLELMFLQVLISYFKSQEINAVFVQWPEEKTTPQLGFESIVNYFAAVIQWPEPKKGERVPVNEKIIQVTRVDYRLAEREPLSIREIRLKSGLRRLSIKPAKKGRETR